MRTFYLGSHKYLWLARPEFEDIPLFVSHRSLRVLKRKFPVAKTRWALDSGGFSELSLYDRWVTTPSEYLEAVEKYAVEVGRLEWAAPQDWMCEPWITAKTGLTVSEHQDRTIQSVLHLRDKAPHLPFVPVLQGWALDDYMAHVVKYEAAGIDLFAEPVVGVGSVCRRQSTSEAGQIFTELHAAGLRNMHGFGVKANGLKKYGHLLNTADSMAWSFRARKRGGPLDGCDHAVCNHCPRYALAWRSALLAGERIP